ITGLAATLPTRAAIAEATCQELDWRRPDGQTRAMSARVALNKMAADGLITLPPPRNGNGNGNGNIPRHRPAGQGELFETSPVTGTLASPGPLTFRPVTTRADSRTRNDLIAARHYPGCTPLAGAQLRYLTQADRAGTVAALGFGASAWKSAPRAARVGWDAPAREARLHLIAGNARFLILPHVRIPHLASAILGRVTRRLPADWQDAPGYPRPRRDLRRDLPVRRHQLPRRALDPRRPHPGTRQARPRPPAHPARQGRLPLPPAPELAAHPHPGTVRSRPRQPKPRSQAHDRNGRTEYLPENFIHVMRPGDIR